MILDDMMAYSEVHEIINLLDEKYKDKIPEKIREFFDKERLKDYKPEIELDIPLKKQKLKRETIVLLAVLNLNYWCDTLEEKQKILDEFTENENERQELLNRYSPDNLFNKRQDTENGFTNTEDLSIIEYKKPSFIQTLLSKISRLFKK